MITRIESFGGFSRERIDWAMRLQSLDESKLQIIIKTAERDNREIVDVEDPKNPGKKIKTKNNGFGKIRYETFETIDVFDAKPEQVEKIIKDALNSAAGKK